MEPSLFKLRSRGEGREVTLTGAVRLEGEREWLLEGPGPELGEIAATLGHVADRLSERLLLLRFGNAVGHVQLPYLGRVEIVSGKWADEHFEWMLADLMEKASTLPFAADAPTALPYDRSVLAREDILYHAFVYLQHVLGDDAPRHERLLPALTAITAEPHRRFERYRREVPLALAGRVDAETISRLATRKDLHRAERSPAPLARHLRGHLPLGIEQVEVRPTLDTPENRFVKSFLDAVLGVLERMRRAVERRRTSTAFRKRVLADAERMERLLRPVRRHSMWMDVGQMTHLPGGSTVLQRRRGYREVFRHHNRMRLAARVPLDGATVQALLETKDIALLYELWCFFTLANTLETLLGAAVEAAGPTRDDWETALKFDLAISWSGGVRLFYNPRFSRSRPGSRHSYSVPLRPDIGLLVGNGAEAPLHLFDAKFRLDKLEAFIPDADAADEIEEDVAEERRGTFKRGDLYKMHTYRDALPTAQSVWVLYPGTTAVFFSAAGGRCSDLEEIGLISEIEGVGALPLIPQQGDHQSLVATLHSLVSRRG